MTEDYTYNVTLSHFIERNEKSGESVFVAYLRGEKTTPITFHGVVQKYPKNTPLLITGNQNNPSAPVECKRVQAQGFSKETTVAYIASKSFPDLGSVAGERIVDILGEDIFLPFHKNQSIEEFSSRIHVSADVLDRFLRRIEKIAIFDDLYETLRRHGCDYHSAEILISKYGADALSVLNSNPYVLLYLDIPLAVCESFAKDAGVEWCDKKRIHAITEHLLVVNNRNGHTRITFDKLCRMFNRVEDIAKTDRHTPPLFIGEEITGGSYRLSEENGELYIYLKKDYEDEETIAEQIHRINSSAVPNPSNVLSMEDIEEICQVKYSVEQKRAFNSLTKSGMKIITGGPGTGKTTLLNGLLVKYKADHPMHSILLCAPTGCAARHMTEHTGVAASTIHKALGIRPFEQEEQPEELKADLIIVDECSMVDIHIMARLLSSIKSGATVILLGDKDQLPSVSAGDVLADLIEYGQIETYTLTKIFRQGNRNTIIDNSAKVMRGEQKLQQTANFRIRRFRSESDMIENAIQLACKMQITPMPATGPVSETKLYTPSKHVKFASGSRRMNRRIHDMRKKGTETVLYGTQEFTVGDQVIFTRNNYTVGYYNGQEGRIVSIQSHTGSVYITIQTEEDRLTVTGKDLDDVDLGYVLTAHKSQGGECENAIIMIPQEPHSLLKRQLLYVEITRARKNVIILSEGDALERAISSFGEYKRDTGLKTMLEL